MYSFGEGSGRKGDCKNLDSSTKGICGLIFPPWLVLDLEVEFLKEFNPTTLSHVEIRLREYPFEAFVICDELKGLAQQIMSPSLEGVDDCQEF